VTAGPIKLISVALFVLEMAHGPNWDDTRGIRDQDAWDAHAAFMDRLVDEGLVVLGGPVGDAGRVMLLIEADSESAIETRLARDPWRTLGLLQIGRIDHWTIWLDGTARSGLLASD
jgi:uncharacterized protein YciI